MAELIIAKREIDDRIILDLSGDIIFGEGTVKLRKEIRRLLEEGKNIICLNLENVRYVDSSGIGELISGLTAINRTENGQLKLLNPTPRLINLLEISKLLSIFDCCNESKASGQLA
jgi:anti-sigma B factor antagonist